MEISFGKFPFQEVWSNGIITRTFCDDVDENELIWHMDRRDRYVRVKESKGWKLQYDNELPIELEAGKIYFIEKETYHRVIRGEGKLILEIKED